MKSKSFRFLWIGQLFANLGDVFYIVGLISILYAVTESALYLALLPFLNTFGRFISGMISPLLLNKYRLKSLLVSSQLCKTIVLLILASWVSFLPSFGISFILCCIFTIAFFDGWAMPATNAILPRLVKENEILKANSFVSMMNESVQLGGWALGGIFVSLFNGHIVIWLTFALFFVSTVILQGIVDNTSVKGKEQKIVEALKEGWLVIWKTPLFRSLHIIIFIESIANVVWVAAILYVFVNEVLNVSEAWWGTINTLFFLGLIIGGFICSKFAFAIENNMKNTLLFSSIGISVITFLFGLNSIAWLSLIFVFFGGLLEQMKGITIHTYLQKEASDEDLPKIYSAQNAFVSFVFGLSTLVFGVIAETVNVQLTFILAGILLGVSAIYLFSVKTVLPSQYEKSN